MLRLVRLVSIKIKLISIHNLSYEYDTCMNYTLVANISLRRTKNVYLLVLTNNIVEKNKEILFLYFDRIEKKDVNNSWEFINQYS